MHSNVVLNDDLRGETAEKKNEIKDAKRCILTLFETMFWMLGLRRNF